MNIKRLLDIMYKVIRRMTITIRAIAYKVAPIMGHIG
jgi:hypothetical protein